MLGGMTAISLLAAGLPLPMAILGAVILVGVFGALLELVFFRHLKSHSPLHMIVITIGLSIVIREAALHIWDEKVRALPYFTGTESSSVTVLGAGMTI